MITPKRESANLDCLRSVAVLLVLASHVLAAVGLPWEGNAVGAAGRLGVLLFFIHTSLVLMMSLARLEKSEGSLAGRFYIRRAFRIYPLAVVAVLTVVMLRIPPMFRTGYQTPSATELWSNLLLIQNATGAHSLTSPLWSLPFEIQMYLALPFLYLLGRRVGKPAVVLGLGFTVWYIEHRLVTKYGIRSLLSFAPWFCMGVASFFRRPARQLPPWLYLACLAFLVGAYLSINQFSKDYRVGWIEWGLGIAFCMILPMFREMQAAQANKGFHLIAKYSYGIYLSHLPILWFAFERTSGGPVVLRSVLCVAMLVGVPVILYHLIEEPFIRLGSRIATAMTKPRRVRTEQVWTTNEA